jgi:hypothetical protein
MAATNYTPIQLYYSTTASAAPTSGNLSNGELAINITDGKLYYKDNGGVVQVIATKGAGTIGGSTTQIQYNNAGALAGNAAMTFNSGTSTTTLTTLNLTNALGAIYGGTAQSAYTQGDFLYASATNTLSKLGIGTVNYILTSTGSIPQWSAPSSIIVQTATNLAGGLAGSVPYQSAVDTTTFLAIGAANRVMTSTGSAPQWVTALTGLTSVSSSSINNTSLTSGRVVYSGAVGIQADSANLTFDGTTLSAAGLSTTGFTTMVKTITAGNSSFNGTAVFAPATPAKLFIGTGTVTDVTSAASATNSAGAVMAMGITPIAASNVSVTYTNASTLYIAGAPSASTNITITNPYALYVAAGASYFGGAVTFAGSASLAALTVTSLTDSGLTSGRVTYASTGGLLVDSASLVFNGTSLGIGTSSPEANAKLTVYGSGVAISRDSSTITPSGYDLKIRSASPKMGLHATAASQNMSIEFSGGGGANALLDVQSGDGLVINTNATERMRITSAGNVGIGTSSPAAPLDIGGNPTYQNQMIWSRGVTDTDFKAVLTSGDTGTQASIGSIGVRYSNFEDFASIQFYRNSAVGNLLFFTGGLSADGTEKMKLDGSGNLGIGTSSPANKLSVADNSASAMIYGTQSGAGDLFAVANSASEKFRITNAGNVGIGTSSPTQKLDVNGFVTTTPGLGSGGGFIVAYGSASANSRSWKIRQDDAAYGDFAIQQSTTQTGSTYATLLTIDRTGNVGIGTTSPSSYVTGLAVAGSTANSGDIGLVKTNSGTANEGGQAIRFFNYGPAQTGKNANVNLGSIYWLASQPSSGAAQDAAAIQCLSEAQNGTSTASQLTFSTVSGSALVKAMTIDSAQNVLIGTTGTILSQGKVGISFNGATNQALNMRTSLASSGSTFVQFENSSGTVQGFISAATTTTTSYNTASTSGTGAQLNASGITFPATQVASADANTLDDYEEGTWTPTYSGFNAVGAVTVTGNYVKIGRKVFLTATFSAATSFTTSTGGGSYMNGLPFTPASGSVGYSATAWGDGNANTSLGTQLFAYGNAYAPAMAFTTQAVTLSVVYISDN